VNKLWSCVLAHAGYANRWAALARKEVMEEKEEILLSKNPPSNIQVGDVLRVVSIRGTYVRFATVEAAQQSVHPTAFGVCPHGVNLGNQACSACEPEKFGVG